MPSMSKSCVSKGEAPAGTSMFIMSTQHMKCGAKHNGVLGKAHLRLNV